MGGVIQDPLYELSMSHKKQLVESSENWKLNVPKAGPRFESRGAAAVAAQLLSAAAALGCAAAALGSADAALGCAPAALGSAPALLQPAQPCSSTEHSARASCA